MFHLRATKIWKYILYSISYFAIKQQNEICFHNIVRVIMINFVIFYDSNINTEMVEIVNFTHPMTENPYSWIAVAAGMARIKSVRSRKFGSFLPFPI